MAAPCSSKIKLLRTTNVRWKDGDVLVDAGAPLHPPTFPTAFCLQATENHTHYVTGTWPANPIFREMCAALVGLEAETCASLQQQLDLLCRMFPALEGAAVHLDKQNGIPRKGMQDIFLFVTELLYYIEGHPLLIHMVRITYPGLYDACITCPFFVSVPQKYSQEFENCYI